MITPILPNLPSIPSERLHDTVKRGDDQLLLSLIKEKASIHLPNNFGNYPIHIAAEEGWDSTVKILMDAGCDVEATNRMGETALMVASKKGSQAVATKLLKRAEVNKQTKKRDSALTLAMRAQKEDMVQLLIQSRADVDGTDNELGQTHLHRAALRGEALVVEALLTARADINATDTKEENTALHISIITKHVPIFFKLINTSANLELPNKKSETAMMLAMQQDRLFFIQPLLDAKANIEQYTDAYYSAFGKAVLNNEKAVVKKMIQCKANIHPVCGEDNPLVVAAEKGYKEIMQMLLAADSTDTPIHKHHRQLALSQAVYYKNVVCVKLLIDAKAHVTDYDETRIASIEGEEIRNLIKQAKRLKKKRKSERSDPPEKKEEIPDEWLPFARKKTLILTEEDVS